MDEEEVEANVDTEELTGWGAPVLRQWRRSGTPTGAVEEHGTGPDKEHEQGMGTPGGAGIKNRLDVDLNVKE